MMALKILVFNCSPRMKKSNTDKILDPLLAGASKAGAEVEKLYARKIGLKPCLGCFDCWLKTPGVCPQKDDWLFVLGKMAEADLIVYATPVYAYNMTVYMKTLFDRTGMLVIQPYNVTTDDGFFHPARYPEIKKKAVLVANALAWDEEVFSILVDNLETIITKAVDGEGNPMMGLVGKILVGCGEILTWEETPQLALQPFYQALENAGEELVREGGLSRASEEKLSVPLWEYLGVKPAEAWDKINAHFEAMLERLSPSSQIE
jgi:hypothetical protein